MVRANSFIFLISLKSHTFGDALCRAQIFISGKVQAEVVALFRYTRSLIAKKARDTAVWAVKWMKRFPNKDWPSTPIGDFVITTSLKVYAHQPPLPRTLSIESLITAAVRRDCVGFFLLSRFVQVTNLTLANLFDRLML